MVGWVCVLFKNGRRAKMLSSLPTELSRPSLTREACWISSGKIFTFLDWLFFVFFKCSGVFNISCAGQNWFDPGLHYTYIHIKFSSPCAAVYPSWLWVAEFLRFREFKRCLPSIDYNGARWHLAWGEIMTRFLKMIRRPCCEHFSIGTVLILPNYIKSPSRRKRACTLEWKTS